MSYFSEALTAAIDESGLSQRAISDQTGLAQSLISKYKNGAALPDQEQLSRLLEAFAGHREQQERIAWSRAKASVPADYHYLFQSPSHAGGETTEPLNSWDDVIERIRIAGLSNASLKETISHLASVY
jgi:transcriptional regulator with XRE-family HTH domain